ncbi:MAG: glycerol-3-phosphate ABC transporter ATP-binding protein [Caldiserica bacterium]|nr:MAG: glycerol-3-phosphate ABC transporter ATP-binding protein [Caldisericota bacterium]
MARVILRNVTKRFGKVVAVDNINLSLKDGEFVVLLGPSGCGKTTTLRLIAGLEEVTSGEIYIGDRVVNDLAPKDRNVAMVFQSYALYPHMSVFENIAFSLRLKHVPKDEIEKRVRRVAEMLQIDKFLNRKPRQLSGGQRQRVALARAIVRNPDVYLMDEPLSNLDAKLRVQTRAELLKLHKKLGTTTIYVTHDQVEAMTLGQRVAIINNGKLEQFDTPENVYMYPKTKFVAGFIGTPPMNFIPAKVFQEDGKIQLKLLNTKIEIPSELKAKTKRIPINRKVILGIRPEDLREEKFLDRDSFVLLGSFPLLFKEDLGSETNLYFNIGLDNPLVVKTSSETKVEMDDVVPIYLNPFRIHLFDIDTGRNLFYNDVGMNG